MGYEYTEDCRKEYKPCKIKYFDTKIKAGVDIHECISNLPGWGGAGAGKSQVWPRQS